jgi:hypothetical protein
LEAHKSDNLGATAWAKSTARAIPWLKWRAGLCVPGGHNFHIGIFSTVDDAARAYDAEVRRRGWVQAKPLNFPQPEELAAYPAQAGERCDERGLPLTLAPYPPIDTQGAVGQRPPVLRAHKPGKSGFFGVRKIKRNKATQWMAAVDVHYDDANYTIGYFATKEEAARAYDAEVCRRGWTHRKRLNFPNPTNDAALPPSAAAGEAPGHGGHGAG